MGSDCSCVERTDPVLDLVSNLDSEAEEILISDSKPSSCSAYTSTDYFYYCPNQNVNNFVLRKMFYSR